MTDLPPDTNERIAKACGFTWETWARGILVEGYPGNFDPATDPAAALFALEAYANCREANAELFYQSKYKAWSIYLGTRNVDHMHGAYNDCADSFCTAICKAILEAEERNVGLQTE